MATADVLSLYFAVLESDGGLADRSEFTVLCEHHEDWAIVKLAESEIVSGKHREASVGAFSTLRQLVDDGGMLHLFLRWEALSRTPMCRLVTTSGLAGDAARVARACDRLRDDPESEHPDVIDSVTGLASVLSALSPGGVIVGFEAVRNFLAGLRVQSGLARRDQLPAMAGESYGRPVAERLGRPTEGNAVWSGVLGLVRVRMRAAGPRSGGALPTVLGLAHDDALASRTLTLADVDFAVRFALSQPRGYSPLPRTVKANLMAVKMARGDCSDNAIERADSLRRQYRQYWRARNGSPSVRDQRLSMDNTLRRVIDEATDAVRTDEEAWGSALWRELAHRLAILEGSAESQGLNADLLLGGVSELANLCRAWYSDRFDAERDRALLVQGGTLP